MSLLHKITATYSSIPTTNAVAFGTLTKSGAGGWKPSGAAAMSITVADPTNPTHFTITANRLVPTAAYVAAPAASYVLTVAVDSIPHTVNITTEANTFTVSSEAEATALTWTNAAFGGKTCAFRGASWGGPAFYEYFKAGSTDNTQLWWSTSGGRGAFTTLTTIKAADITDRPILKIAGGTAGVGYASLMRNPNNMLFYYLDLFAEWIPFVSDPILGNSGGCTFTAVGGTFNTRFEKCIMRGTATDPAVGLYFYLSILNPDFSAGMTFSATLNGANLASVSFTTDDATMYSDIQASILAHPDVQSLTLSTPVGMRTMSVQMKSTSQTPVAFLPTFTGRNGASWRLNTGSCFNGGIIGGATNIVGGALEFVDNEIYGNQVLLKIPPTAAGDGSFLFVGNNLHDFGSDCLKCTGTSRVTIQWNTLYNGLAAFGDGNHGDFLQWLAGTAADDITGDISGNILCSYRTDGLVVTGGFKTDTQGFFMQHMKSGSYVTCKIYNNIIITTIYNGILLKGKNSYAWRNTVICLTDPLADTAPWIAEATDVQDPISNTFVDNIAMSYNYVGGSGSAALASGNLDITPQTLGAYFANPVVPSNAGGLTALINDIVAKFTPIGAAIGKGAIGSYIDFNARTVDTTGHPW